MAIKIEFVGYVNKVREYDWGVAYDVAHNQMQKKGDQWEAVGRDYLSVVGPEGGQKFAENDLVTIKGNLKTKVFDKQDGSKGIALNVRADEMSKVEKGGGQKTTQNPPVQQVWPEAAMIPGTEVPF